MEQVVKSKLHRRFCDNLRAARLERGLTQADLAKLLKCSTPTVCNFENGRNSPTLDTIEEIAAALKLNPIELMAAKKLAVA